MYTILFYCESYFFCVVLTMQYFKDLFTTPKNETNVCYITFLKFLRSFYYKFLASRHCPHLGSIIFETQRIQFHTSYRNILHMYKKLNDLNLE